MSRENEELYMQCTVYTCYNSYDDHVFGDIVVISLLSVVKLFETDNDNVYKKVVPVDKSFSESSTRRRVVNRNFWNDKRYRNLRCIPEEMNN